MQFDLENIKNLLGKVVYINGQALPKLEPYTVCGYDHSDDFLQLCSLSSGKYISGIHPENVVVAALSQELKCI